MLIEKLEISQKQLQKLSAKELRSAKYRYVNEEVTREVTEFVEAGFVITTFDSSGNLIQEATELNAADAATYDAEKLFGIDLNGDSKQGRNIQEISKYDLADSYGWTIFDEKTVEIENSQGEETQDSLNTINSKNDFSKTFEITIPQYTEPGNYQLERITTSDVIGNYASIEIDELNSLGFDTDFEIINTNYFEDLDSTPPSIQSLELSKKVIDVSNNNQSFYLNASLFDDLSGDVLLSVNWSSPSGEHSVGVYLDPSFINSRYAVDPRLSELIIDGNETRYKNYEITLPQYSEPGTWTLRSISIWDKANNRETYYWNNYGPYNLNELGLDVDFEVISTNADLTPPSIQSLELSKKVLDVSEGDQSFTYDISIFDNLAGFDEEYPGWFSFTWQSPSGDQRIYSSPRIRGEDEFVIDNNLGGDYEIYKIIIIYLLNQLKLSFLNIQNQVLIL